MPDKSNPSTEQLLNSCIAGDEHAWQLLVNRYERLIYTIPLRYGLSEDEANDVFQHVWLQLLQHLSKITNPDRLSAWLVTTAKRACWDKRRGAEYERVDSVDPTELPEPLWGDAPPSTEDIIAQYEQHTTLQKAMAGLNERCRDLIRYLFHETELNYADIAVKMGMSVGAIGPTRARCLQKLKRLLEKLDVSN